ncbi:pheromone processing endoprotease [Phlyctochytrium bullatum]|nr:pheromone processing endoprotease [Phlyctochytrium bullatum]
MTERKDRILFAFQVVPDRDHSDASLHHHLHRRAELAANDLDVDFFGRVGELPDYFQVSVPKSQLISNGTGEVDQAALKELLGRISDHPHVVWVEQQVPRRRLFKRDPPLEARFEEARIHNRMGVDPEMVATKFNISDPLFVKQWHLINREPSEIGNDINVTGVWDQGIFGKNVTVCLVDDGLDYEHDDLRENFVGVKTFLFAEGSYDFNDHVDLPKPRLPEDRHGTRCAGEIAAKRNEMCGVGIAFHSRVAGVRILSGALTEADEAAAINYNMQENHIYSCSWGPPDDGKSMDAPPRIVKEAVLNGIRNGRGGLGSVFVFAAGNGGAHSDNWYGYWGAGPCTEGHGGTSAAAPIVSGILALVLSIRPDLSWRDVQHLAVETAVPINLQDPSWELTSTGRKYSHRFGYGKVDSWAIVEAAKTWKNVNPQVNYTTPVLAVNQEIPQGDSDARAVFAVEPSHVSHFLRLEHITVTVKINHTRRGDVNVRLISPANVTSYLAVKRPGDMDANGFNDWTFMTVKHWGEKLIGNWTVTVIDHDNPEDMGIFVHCWMVFWGESAPAKPAPAKPEKPASPSPIEPPPTVASPSAAAPTSQIAMNETSGSGGVWTPPENQWIFLSIIVIVITLAACLFSMRRCGGPIWEKIRDMLKFKRFGGYRFEEVRAGDESTDESEESSDEAGNKFRMKRIEP